MIGVSRTLSPFAFVAGAQAMVSIGEDESALGRHLPQALLGEGGLDTTGPSAMMVVHGVGWRSHRVAGATFSAWPFPRTATPDDLAAIAREQALVRDEPEPGDIALVWSAAHKEYVHAAIVTRVDVVDGAARGRPRHGCTVVEGQVTEVDGVRRLSVRERPLSFCPADGDLFVRWDALDRRSRFGDPFAASTIPPATHLPNVDLSETTLSTTNRSDTHSSAMSLPARRA